MRAYYAYRKRMGKIKPQDHSSTGNRKYLKITDNQEPSDPNSVPYIGWQIDRHLTASYGFNQRNGSIDSTGYYMAGHYAIRQFWHQMNATAWEQGPDNEEFLDGGGTRLNMLKGKRWMKRGIGMEYSKKK
jgi:hypothetical protein